MFFEQLSSKASLALKFAVVVMAVLAVYWTGSPEFSRSGLTSSPASQSGLMKLPPTSKDQVHTRPKSVSVAPLTNVAPVTPPAKRKKFRQAQEHHVTAGIVDVNESPAEELAHLPGIGSVLAERIVAHRRSHGAFRHIEELLLVPGIGQKRFQQLRPFVGVREPHRTSHIPDEFLRTAGFHT